MQSLVREEEPEDCAHFLATIVFEKRHGGAFGGPHEVTRGDGVVFHMPTGETFIVARFVIASPICIGVKLFGDCMVLVYCCS